MKYSGFLPYFTRSQRRGILFLLFLIVFIQIILFRFDKFISAEKVENYQPDLSLQKQYDSLKALAVQENKKKIYPFNPNYLSDEKAYFLGISLEQLNKINVFRKQGNYFKDKREFKQVSGISDSLFDILSPYIKLSPFKQNKNIEKNTFKPVPLLDINRATASDLMKVNGVGAVLSKRIVKYRNSIGGFTGKKQLNKVYGLKPEVIKRIWQRFYLKPSPNPAEKNIIKKPINRATVEDLKQIYGIGDKLATRIIKYREMLGGFTIKEQLNEVYGLSSETLKEVWKYYKIENPNKNILKINVNEANIRELAKNPYISYQLAKKIVSYRTFNGAFHTFDDLLQVEDFPKEKLKLISLFLKLK
jgi:competence ComEA-like helix-hairpin-helix protein